LRRCSVRRWFNHIVVADSADDFSLGQYGIVRRTELPRRIVQAKLKSNSLRVVGPGLLASPASGLEAWWQELAVRLGLVTHRDLVDAVACLAKNAHGKSLLRLLLELRTAELVPTESYLETRCLQVLRRFGIVGLERQVEFFDHRGRIGRVDFVFCGVVVECDSEEWHTIDNAFHVDRERRSRLLAIGHPVIEVTKQHIEFGAADFVADLRSAVDLLARANMAG
jgi:hypothetical protein